MDEGGNSGGGHGNQQGQKSGRGGRGNGQPPKKGSKKGKKGHVGGSDEVTNKKKSQKKKKGHVGGSDEVTNKKKSKKGKKGHVGGSDEVTNLPTVSIDNDKGEAEEGEVERPSEDDTDAAKEQVGNQSNKISTEWNKLSGVPSRQFAMYLRVITSPLFSQFLDQSNASQIAQQLNEYESHIHSNEKCQVSSCNSKHAQYSRLCEHHLTNFIHSNMVEQFGRTNLQMLVASASDGKTQAQQNALSRTNFPEDAIPRDHEHYAHPNSQTIRHQRCPFISDEAACSNSNNSDDDSEHGHHDAHDDNPPDDGHRDAHGAMNPEYVDDAPADDGNRGAQDINPAGPQIFDGQTFNALLGENPDDVDLEDLFLDLNDIEFNSDDGGGDDGGKEHT